MPKEDMIGKFVGIPMRTLQLKQWREYTPATRSVYTTMLMKYFHSGPKATGRVKWKQDEIAEVAGLSLNTIKRSVGLLIENEWIRIWKHGGRWLDGTEYEVNPLYADWEETPERTEDWT